jgi:hypothetical protein
VASRSRENHSHGAPSEETPIPTPLVLQYGFLLIASMDPPVRYSDVGEAPFRRVTECSETKGDAQISIKPRANTLRSPMTASFFPRTSRPTGHARVSRRYLSPRQYSRTLCVAFSKLAAV